MSMRCYQHGRRRIHTLDAMLKKYEVSPDQRKTSSAPHYPAIDVQAIREAALAAVNFRHKKTPHNGEALLVSIPNAQDRQDG
jgi:hypothetical protein